MKITLTELKDLTQRAILSYGYTTQEADTLSEVMLYAQLRGNNQGVVKLIGAGIPKGSPGEVQTIKETPVSAFINANQNHAMLVVSSAVDIALTKARASGIAVVGVNGINTSSGALGFYARKIANAGFVGIVCSGSMETVAPHGSSQAMFGTNPLAIAMPSSAGPIVFDMTTAAMAYFGVVEASTAGRQLPEGIAYDKAGVSTTDPAAVMDDGSLKTFDAGHKGSGLSFMVQALTGPLMNAYFTGIGDVSKNWGGHFILAINPELFAGVDAMKEGMQQMKEKVKSSKTLPGVEEVLVPGERGDSLTEAAVSSGEIEIEDNLYAELKRVAG